MSMTDQFKQIAAQAPDGANPYAFVMENLPPFPVTGDGAPQAFTGNMATIISLYGVAIIVGTFTLILKYKQNALWFFKAREVGDNESRLWLPNTTVMFTCWAIFYCASAATYIVLLITAQQRLTNTSDAQSMMVLIWLPMVYSIWTEFWGMAGALLMTNPNARLFGIKARPWMLNAFALAYFVAVPPAMTPYFAWAAQTGGHVEDHYAKLMNWLSTSAANWDGSSSFSVSPAMSSMSAEMAELQYKQPGYLGQGFQIFLYFMIIATAAFLPTSLCYLRLLRKQLGHAAPSHIDSQRDSKGSARSDKFESLQMSYQVMVVEACLVMATCCAYIGLTAWGGFTVRTLAANPILGILQHCLFYWMFAAFGTPIVCLIAYRTWKTYCEEKQINKRLSSSGGTGSSSGRKPVHVSTEVQVSVADPYNSWSETDTFDTKKSSSGRDLEKA